MNDFQNRFEASIWSRLTPGSKIGSGSSATGLIAFFLPWILVSCGGQEIRLSGYHLGTGSGPLSGTGAEGQGQILLVALGFIAVLFITYRYLQGSSLAKENSLGVLAIGGLLILLHLAIYNGIQSELNDAGLFSIQLGQIQFGFWLSFLASAGVAAGGYLNYQDSTLPVSRSSRAVPPTKVPTARLELVSGPKKGRTVSLALGRTTFGRGSQATIRLQNKFVSRMHASLEYSNNAWYLQDLDSSGGTFLNGNKIDGSQISDGDEIRLGETRMQFWSS
jgi:hypothetical protein